MEIYKKPQVEEDSKKIADLIVEVKDGVKRFGRYLEKNQDDYYKAYPNESTWEDDLVNGPINRTVTRSAEFGAEQNEYLHSQMRQDPHLAERITNRNLPSANLIRKAVVVKKKKPVSMLPPVRRRRRRTQ